MFPQKNGIYYINPYCTNLMQDEVYVRGVGIDESVEGKMLSFGKVNQYCLMYFHTPVSICVGDGIEFNGVKESVIIWDRWMPNHYGACDKTWMHSWLVCGGSSVERMMAECGIELNRPIALPIAERINRHLRTIYDELNLPAGADSHILKLQIELLLCDIRRCMEHGVQLCIPERLNKLEQYINCHLDSPLTLAALAAVSHLSIPRLSVLCKTYYNESPMALVHRKRMTRAASLLRDPSVSVKEVALECGFSSQLYFSNRFHRFWKVAPRDYRNMM